MKHPRPSRHRPRRSARCCHHRYLRRPWCRFGRSPRERPRNVSSTSRSPGMVSTTMPVRFLDALNEVRRHCWRCAWLRWRPRSCETRPGRSPAGPFLRAPRSWHPCDRRPSLPVRSTPAESRVVAERQANSREDPSSPQRPTDIFTEFDPMSNTATMAPGSAGWLISNDSPGSIACPARRPLIRFRGTDYNVQTV